MTKNLKKLTNKRSVSHPLENRLGITNTQISNILRIPISAIEYYQKSKDNLNL